MVYLQQTKNSVLFSCILYIKIKQLFTHIKKRWFYWALLFVHLIILESLFEKNRTIPHKRMRIIDWMADSTECRPFSGNIFDAHEI